MQNGAALFGGRRLLHAQGKSEKRRVKSEVEREILIQLPVPTVGAGVLDSPHNAKRCHPERSAAQLKDLVYGKCYTPPLCKGRCQLPSSHEAADGGVGPECLPARCLGRKTRSDTARILLTCRRNHGRIP